MSTFERETDDVLEIVHRNPNRRGITQTIGYIVTEDEARQLVAQKTHDPNMGLTVMLILLSCMAVASAAVAVMG